MKRNTLTTAVLAGLTGMAGMVSVSNATGVHVNPEGTGQVLIYPFYTARGGNDTLISIVNTTKRGKAVKVRFREALNSREVLDFHLYMSPFDVWTAAVTANDDGGATLFTSDTSCTVPAIPADGVDFLTFDFSQAPVAGQFAGTQDGAGTGIERTASGYVEVIEMASMTEPTLPTGGTAAANAAALAALAFPGWVEYASKHVAGVPRNCQALVNAWTENLPSSAVAGGRFVDDASDAARGPFEAASGGLFGAANIINVEEGTMFSFNAVALENFWTSAHDISESHSTPGLDEPNLALGDNTTSHVLHNGVMVAQTWGESIQAVSAALTQAKITNEYVTEAALGAQTEWVVTFPTKSYHTDPFQSTRGGAATAGAAIGGTPSDRATQFVAPFTAGWNTARAAVTGVQAARAFSPACEGFQLNFWDREEARPADAPAGARPPVFSPKPFDPSTTARPEFQLCSEANVISFSDAGTSVAVGDASGILGEPVRASGLGLVNFGLPYQSGWAEIDLVTGIFAGTDDVTITEDARVATASGATIKGLPVVGVSVTTYTNGDLGAGVLANYGGTFSHRGSRVISN